MLLAEQVQQRAFDQALAEACSKESGLKLHIIAEVVRFDETPMRAKATSHQDRCASALQGGTRDLEPSGSQDVIAQSVATLVSGSARVHRSTGPQKLVQYESSHVYVVSLPKEGAGRAFYCLASSPSRRLFNVDHTTGETLQEVMLRSSLATPGVLQFESKVRLVCGQGSMQCPRRVRSCSRKAAAWFLATLVC